MKIYKNVLGAIFGFLSRKPHLFDILFEDIEFENVNHNYDTNLYIPGEGHISIAINKTQDFPHYSLIWFSKWLLMDLQRSVG